MNQDSAMRDYQEYLEKNILKLNHKSFNQIVVLGSANFVPFMQLPAGTRRQVIEDLLDIQIFSTMNNLLKEKVISNKEDLVAIGFEMKSVSDKIEMHKKHLETLRTNNDDIIKQKQVNLDAILKSKADAESEIKRYEELNNEADLSISDKHKIQAKYDKLDDLRTQVNVKLVKLKKDVRFFESNNECPMCKQGIEDGHKHDIINKNTVQINEIESGTELLQKEVTAAMDRIVEIQDINKQIGDNNKKISELNTKISMWNNFEASALKEINDLRHTVAHDDEHNTDLQTLKNDLKDAINKKEVLQKEKQILDVAAMLLKDGGIKTKIIKQYIPVINQLINKYLSAMDFFVNFELNENFEETIKSRYRDEFTYASFSEGEKLRIDLALLFAWRSVAKLRNSSSTNLLIMDEVFDSSLDGGGTEEFIKILNGLTQDTNVFIISHKGDQLYDKFHSVIKFEKVKNFSRIAT
jgi:DNA repair exonuclease SbcCD ATPase subunit